MVLRVQVIHGAIRAKCEHNLVCRLVATHELPLCVQQVGHMRVAQQLCMRCMEHSRVTVLIGMELNLVLQDQNTGFRVVAPAYGSATGAWQAKGKRLIGLGFSCLLVEAQVACLYMDRIGQRAVAGRTGCRRGHVDPNLALGCHQPVLLVV